MPDARLTTRGKSSAFVESVKRRQTTAVKVTARRVQTTADKSQPRPRKDTGRWVERGGFISAQSLVDLIDSTDIAPSRRR